MNTIYESFTLELWCMHCTSNLVLREWKIKTDFFQIIYFIKHKNMAAEKNHRVTINLKKQFLTVITWNNKRSPKQVVPIIVYDSFLFRQSKKDCSILLSVWVFVGFPDIKRPKKYCLRKENLLFCILIVILICKRVNKNGVSKYCFCFRLFLWSALK